MKDLYDVFVELEQSVGDIPMQLQSGHRDESNKTIQHLANSIDSFCRVSVLAGLFPEQFAALNANGQTADLFKDFSPILNDFCKALEDNDIVMISDLAEYEIKPKIAAMAGLLEDLA
jgi:hypothetical protein